MEEIHIQSFVAAPPADVWRVLVGRADVVLDALPVAAWPDAREEKGVERLRTPWPVGRGATGRGGGTAVEITLAPVAAGTRVDLRHEGWDSGPETQDALAGHFAGWLQSLAALGLLVETGRDPRASSAQLGGRERYFASGEIPARAAAVFRALTDPEVLVRWSAGALEGAELVDALEGRYARWRTAAPDGGASGEVVMILRPTPRGTHCAVAEYGVVGQSPSARWPAMLERLARFLR